MSFHKKIREFSSKIGKPFDAFTSNIDKEMTRRKRLSNAQIEKATRLRRERGLGPMKGIKGFVGRRLLGTDL